MVQFTKVISTAINDLLRYIKVQRYGLDDIQEANESAPFGDDANPVKGMVAIYSPTSQRGEMVIIGYINKNRLAEIGEKRIFSTDSTGDLSTYIWLKNDGTMELGGIVDNAVRYTPLNAGLQAEVAKIGTNLSAILVNLTSLNVAVNALVPGAVPTPYVITPVDVDISNSKINEIKTL